MKVAYLVNCYSKVSHTFIRREVRALEAHGQPVERFSVRPAESVLVDEADLEEARRTHVLLDAGLAALLLTTLKTAFAEPARFLRALALTLRMGLASHKGFLRNFAYLVEACELARHLRERGVDHLHAHFGTNSTTVAMLVHTLGGPGYSFTVHGPEEFDMPLSIGLRDKIERARFVVAISSYGRSQLFRQCGHEHWSKIHIVRCGLDASFLDREPLPVPEGTERLWCTGRFSDQKGHTLLSEAFAEVAKARPATTLVLVGDGELRGEVEAQIAKHDMHARVELVGWASNTRVQEELTKARALVMASFAEGLPVVIMEALAMARPVVSTYVAGIPELVNESCGVLVPPGSREALARGMERILGLDRAAVQALGQHGRARVRALHDARVEAAHMKRLFERYAANDARVSSAVSPEAIGSDDRVPEALASQP